MTAIHETKTNTYLYWKVVLHKLASIKFFNKNPNEATISIVFNKFIAALRDYEYVGRMTEALDECTCIMLLNYLINIVVDIRRHINIFKRVEIKGSYSQRNK